MADLIRNTMHGLFCEAGGFFIDPWQPVDVALITHAHGDHARWGSRLYVSAQTSLPLLRARLGPNAPLQGVAFGEVIERNGVKISFHPAGHILGSAQIRVEYRGETWVASGDYKTVPDPLGGTFEPLRCHTFITESTFGLPIYCWPDETEVFGKIDDWWRSNQEADRTSVLFGYSLGKAQRLLLGLNPERGPIYVHGSVLRMNRACEEAGARFPPYEPAEAKSACLQEKKGLLLAPPSGDDTPWLRKFGEVSTAFASGWMQIRGTRRRRALDRGFVLSDHADWQGLNETIVATGAERILVTHGYTEILARWCREKGLQSESLSTAYKGEEVAEDLESIPAFDSLPPA